MGRDHDERTARTLVHNTHTHKYTQSSCHLFSEARPIQRERRGFLGSRAKRGRKGKVGDGGGEGEIY